MREYFRGWKRNAGVASLVVACVFAVGWIRTLQSVDILNFNDWHHRWNFIWLQEQSIVWGIFPRELEGIHLGYFCGPVTEEPSLDDMLEPNGRRLGFAVGPLTLPTLPGVANVARAWVIPCWAMVLPLTLLSAYLLLSKPRPKPKQPVNHA